MRTSAIGLGISLAACGGVPFPQVRAAVDPAAHELFLIAFDSSSPRYLLLERDLGAKAEVELWLVDPEAEARFPWTRPKGLPDALLRVALDPEGAIALVQSDELGHTLDAQGFAWPEVVRTPTLTTSAGTLSVVDDAVHIREDTTDVALVSLGPGETRAGYVWLVAQGGARVALSIDYAATPRARDVRVIDLRRAQALLLSARAYEAHGRSDFERAARLWFEALELAPRIPETLYNLACAQARLGHAQTAMGYLERAIEVGGGRFRAMARVDVDLAPLRTTRRFRDVVDALRPARD
jgi:hypothetical protein